MPTTRRLKAVPEPTPEEPNVDAFPDAEGPEDEDEQAEEEAVARLEQITYEPDIDAPLERVQESYEVPHAVLRSGRFRGSDSGTVYVMQWELTADAFDAALAAARYSGKGWDVTWAKVHLGTGISIASVVGRRDADGAMRYTVDLHLSPQDDIGFGRATSMAGKQGKLVLDPMQGTLFGARVE